MFWQIWSVYFEFYKFFWWFCFISFIFFVLLLFLCFQFQFAINFSSVVCVSVLFQLFFLLKIFNRFFVILFLLLLFTFNSLPLLSFFFHPDDAVAISIILIRFFGIGIRIMQLLCVFFYSFDGLIFFSLLLKSITSHSIFPGPFPC